MKRRGGKSERARRTAAVAAVIIVLGAGLFAAGKSTIELSPAKPAATPSGDKNALRRQWGTLGAS